MARKKIKATPVEQVQVRQNRSVSDLLKAMGRTGFQGKSLALCADTLEKMFRDKQTKILARICRVVVDDRTIRDHQLVH